MLNCTQLNIDKVFLFVFQVADQSKSTGKSLSGGFDRRECSWRVKNNCKEPLELVDLSLKNKLLLVSPLTACARLKMSCNIQREASTFQCSDLFFYESSERRKAMNGKTAKKDWTKKAEKRDSFTENSKTRCGRLFDTLFIL
jgi:hypothetical protein